MNDSHTSYPKRDTIVIGVEPPGILSSIEFRDKAMGFDINSHKRLALQKRGDKNA